MLQSVKQCSTQTGAFAHFLLIIAYHEDTLLHMLST